MCGILLVKSKHSIPLQQHLEAFVQLQSRGPDFCRYDYKNNIFIGQAVLHITGSADYYHTVHNNFLAYNGEIYNYRDFGAYSNDIEFVHHAVENDLRLLRQGWGPWAWAWTDGDTVRYATDPQGERCLYQYQDDDILIVCSEVAPILNYIEPIKQSISYGTRHWAMLAATPWQGISRITAGQLYKNGQACDTIDTIWSWIQPVKYDSIEQAQEEFDRVWRETMQTMTPSCTAALAYSGGLDSSVILSHSKDMELYAVNTVGKDPIVDQVERFLTTDEQSRLHHIASNEADWARAFWQVVDRTRMPVQSWSFVGQWIISQRCQQRVLFTGVGADELFGGYAVYSQLTFDTAKSSSPYSANGDAGLWQQCLSAYDNQAVPATLLMDYLYQVAACDVRGIDVIAGAHGIETRNPFLARPVMQLALGLPTQYRVGTVAKPLIRNLFLKRWDQSHVLPKKGFSGHCNDALPWLGVTIQSSGNRDQDWQQIVLKSFYNNSNQPNNQTSPD